MKKNTLLQILLALACSTIFKTIPQAIEHKYAPLSCSLEEFAELNDAFEDISFEYKVNHIRELIMLRKSSENDSKILKKIELLLCSTDLLRILPKCVEKDRISIEEGQSSFVMNYYREHGIDISDSRYEILELAVLFRFKELIEFIYEFVSPEEIIDVAGCSNDIALLNDLEILLSDKQSDDVEDMLDFLLGLKSLQEIEDAYPSLCEERTSLSKDLKKSCLLIDQEIKRRKTAALNNFYAELEERSEDDCAYCSDDVDDKTSLLYKVAECADAYAAKKQDEVLPVVDQKVGDQESNKKEVSDKEDKTAQDLKDDEVDGQEASEEDDNAEEDVEDEFVDHEVQKELDQAIINKINKN